MRSEAVEQHCVASSPRHTYHLAHTGIPLQDRPVPTAPHGLCEQVRAVDLLGMLKEVSVVRQVRPRPVGRASARRAADVPEQHDEERHEPTAPASRIPIEVTVG